MQLSKYIKKLLPEHETVIFPGLGAFFSTYNPAQIDEKSEEITPPSTTVSFDPRIRHNDGLLVGKIAENEAISQEEALKRIEGEKEEIMFRLDKGEEVEFGNLGVFFTGENREISFRSTRERNFFPDAFGLEATLLGGRKGNTPGREGKPAATAFSGKEEHPVQKGLPQRRRGPWVWLVLLLILVVAAVIVYLTREKKEQAPPVEIIVESPEEVAPEEEAAPVVIPRDTLSTDSAVVLIADTVASMEAPVDSANYIKTDPSGFYLIGGSFSKHKNAEKYFQKMKKEGYNPFHLGKKGNFYLVGIDIFDNEIEAYGAQYNFLDKYPDSGVWIYIPE
jgi:hypothetical protein